MRDPNIRPKHEIVWAEAMRQHREVRALENYNISVENMFNGLGKTAKPLSRAARYLKRREARRSSGRRQTKRDLLCGVNDTKIPS